MGTKANRATSAVVEGGPDAAGRPEDRVGRPPRSGGAGHGGPRELVGVPARVLGSVNNRRPAFVSDATRTSHDLMTQGTRPEAARDRNHEAGEPRPARRLTGERPMEGVTPDSLLALHAAGYRTVIERLGDGPMLDVGCGQGFESARFVSEDRPVFGADYSAEAVELANRRWSANGLRVAQMNALSLGLRHRQLPLGLLLAPDRALRRSRGPRPGAGPGAGRRRDRLLPHPQRARPTSRTPSTSTSSSPPSCRTLLGPSLPRRESRGSTPSPRSRPTSPPDGSRPTRCSRSTCSTSATGSRGRGTSASTPGSCPSPTGSSPGGTPAGTTGITADDFFVTDQLDRTTMVLFATASRPRRRPDRAGPDAHGRAHRRDRAGKSTVADLLVEHGAELVDADLIAREVVEPGGPAYQPLVDRFGPGDRRRRGQDRPPRAGRHGLRPTRRRWPTSTPSPTRPSGSRWPGARRRSAGTDKVVVLDIPLLNAVHRQTLSLAAVVVVDTPTETGPRAAGGDSGG